MYKARLQGSYYEMGVQQGELIKRKILPTVWAQSFHEAVAPERREYADECEQIVRRFMPGFLDELQGTSDAVGVDYDAVKIWPLCSYAKLQQSCTAVAISAEHTASGKPLFIRNYDYLDVDREYLTAFWTKPESGHSNLGFSDTLSGRYCGFNEKGLVAASSISGYGGPTQPGLVFSLVIRWILDHYSTAGGAAEFLRKIPHFHGWNFLLCDERSNILLLETAPERVEAVSFTEGIGVSTNHYVSAEMLRYEEKGWRSAGSTVKRYENVLEWFRSRKGPVTVDDACRLAKSRVDDGGLCDRFDGVEGGTLWSWIHVSGEPDVLVSEGPPCRYPYRKIPAS